MGNYIFTEDDHSSDGASSSSSNSSGAQQGESVDIRVSSDSSHQSSSSSSGDDSSSSSTHISQHTFESDGDGSNSTTSFSSDTRESSQSSRDAEDESGSWSRITEHAEDTDGPSSNSVADTQDSSASSNGEEAQSAPSSYDHNAAAQDKIASQIDDYEDGWPVNDNGEYLVIDVTIRPQADIDLTTIFGLTADANGPDNALDFDTLVKQLAQVSEDTYIEVDYHWGAKPDLVVTLEPNFNIDSDVFARVNYDADDVVLDALLDIIQTAVPTSDASVFVDFDPDDSDHDGHVFDIDVDVDLSVFVDQGLDAYVDATLPD